MTRPLRTNSGTGIYHVMLRGINKQIIFESPLDYGKFLNLLYQMVYPIDESRKPMPPKCIIYAYCLMPNHVHLLKSWLAWLMTLCQRLSVFLISTKANTP